MIAPLVFVFFPPYTHHVVFYPVQPSKTRACPTIGASHYFGTTLHSALWSLRYEFFHFRCYFGVNNFFWDLIDNWYVVNIDEEFFVSRRVLFIVALLEINNMFRWQNERASPSSNWVSQSLRSVIQVFLRNPWPVFTEYILIKKSDILILFLFMSCNTVLLLTTTCFELLRLFHVVLGIWCDGLGEGDAVGWLVKFKAVANDLRFLFL